MNLKANLRQSVRARLRSVATAAELDSSASGLRVQKNQALIERLVLLFPFITPPAAAVEEVWAAFQPHGYEPDLRPALIQIKQNAQRAGRDVHFVFPRIQPEADSTTEPSADSRTEPMADSRVEPSNTMDFFLPQDESSFLGNAWGLREPAVETSRKIEPGEITGYLIPAVAFDRSGQRLGRGKGYFDRYLARVDHPLKTKIGIAFDDQILDEDLVVDAHDIAMDIVLSESRCLARRALGLRAKLRGAIPCDEFEDPSQIHSLKGPPT